MWLLMFFAGVLYLFWGLLACVRVDDKVGGILPGALKADVWGYLALLIWPLACGVALAFHAWRAVMGDAQRGTAL